MAPKQDLVYSRGRSKSVAPSSRLVIVSNDDDDPQYVPPGIRTSTRATRTTQGTPKMVVSDVVTASQSDEKRILTGTSSGSATGSEGASGFEEAFGSEEASISHGPNISATPVDYASSDEADSADSTPAPLIEVLAPAADYTNRLSVEGQYQVYMDAKPLNNKGVMT